MNKLTREQLDAPYVAILAREFRKARGIPPDTRLQVTFRPDESIIVLEGTNVWIMSIGSDDDDFQFFDNDGVELRFPMPQDWLDLGEPL